VAAARLWNSLLSHVTAAPSLSVSIFCSEITSVHNSHYLMPLSDSSLIYTVPTQWLVIFDTMIVISFNLYSFFHCMAVGG